MLLSEVLGVDDGVGVALLGQEALPVGGVLLVGGVAGDDRVEVGLAAVLLGAHDPPEPLGLLLARAEGARDLDRDARPGQVDGEVRDLGDHERADLPAAEGVVKALALAHRRRPGDDGGVQVLGDLGELVHVLADDQGRLALVAGQEGLDDR